jgi:hypothetical protein
MGVESVLVDGVVDGGLERLVALAPDRAELGAFDVRARQRGEFAPALEEVVRRLDVGPGGCLQRVVDHGGHAALGDHREDREPCVALEGPADVDACCGDAIDERPGCFRDTEAEESGLALLLAS